MMNDILGVIASSGGIAGETPPPVETGWVLDLDEVQSGHTVGDDDTSVENTSGGTNYLWVVPSVEKIPDTEEWLYFEVHIGPDVYSGSDTAYNGYIAFLDRREIYIDELSASPTGFGHVGWRGIGEVRWTGGLRTNTDLIFGDSVSGGRRTARVVMQPSTSKVFLASANGLFQEFDYSDITGSPATQPTKVATFTRAPLIGRRIGLQPRDTGNKLKLVTLEADFRLPIPSGCVSLGSVAPSYDVY